VVDRSALVTLWSLPDETKDATEIMPIPTDATSNSRSFMLDRDRRYTAVALSRSPEKVT